VPQDPEARIENYLDRLERLALDPKKEQDKKLFRDEPRPRALSLLREMVMNKYVRPRKEKMAAGAAKVEERVARELGIEARYGEQELAARGEIAVADLEKSLDNWISYLSDANEPYPTWFRYYAFRNVLDLGDYDKDKGEFTKRSEGSARLFPDIDRGSLAYMEQMMEAAKDPSMLERLRRAQESTATPVDQLLTKEKAAQFAKLSFAKQYAEGIKTAGEITAEMKEETKGSWVRYQQGTDPTALWASLQNKGAPWCTKGFATAETQLKGGDLSVLAFPDAFPNQGGWISGQSQPNRDGSGLGSVQHLVILLGLLLGGGVFRGDLFGRDNLEGGREFACQPFPGGDGGLGDDRDKVELPFVGMLVLGGNLDHRPNRQGYAWRIQAVIGHCQSGSGCQHDQAEQAGSRGQCPPAKRYSVY